MRPKCWRVDPKPAPGSNGCDILRRTCDNLRKSQDVPSVTLEWVRQAINGISSQISELVSKGWIVVNFLEYWECENHASSQHILSNNPSSSPRCIPEPGVAQRKPRCGHFAAWLWWSSLAGFDHFENMYVYVCYIYIQSNIPTFRFKSRQLLALKSYSLTFPAKKQSPPYQTPRHLCRQDPTITPPRSHKDKSPVKTLLGPNCEPSTNLRSLMCVNHPSLMKFCKYWVW